MGIMDVLESLSGPEYDEPTPLEQEAAPEEAVEEIPEAVTEPEAAEPLPQELPEEPESEEEIPEAWPDEMQLPDSPAPKRRIRAEWIMAIVAALAGILLGVVVLLAQPYFTPDEDPDSLPQRHEPNRATEPVVETYLEPTISETEPKNPTIPPAPNPYDRYDFQYNRNNYLVLQNVESYPGVDVSAYQGDIDWEKVKASGIDFAIIRLGYRGYESGKLVEDAYAKKNLEGAAAAGLKVGAYFFSQALNTKEADEELEFMMEILGEQYLAMPLVLDWEIPTSSARSARMDARTLTDIQLHFCKKASDMGYQPMVYFNWHQSENLYFLHELEDYPFWLALYQDRMTYPWDVEMWQYTSTGRVPGINGDVDINVYMPY